MCDWCQQFISLASGVFEIFTTHVSCLHDDRKANHVSTRTSPSFGWFWRLISSTSTCIIYLLWLTDIIAWHC